MRAGTKIAIVLALAGLVATISPVFASGNSNAAKSMAAYTGKVQNRVLSDTASGGQGSFIVELTQQADLSRAYGMKDQDARGWYVYRTLKQTAQRTQAPIKAMLDKQGVSYRSFWVANEIIVRSGDRPLVNSLAARPDVKVIEANDASNWLTATDSYEFGNSLGSITSQPNTIEPNVTLVHAPDLWSLGFNGAGIVVGNQDTGMRWSHNALKPHYRGWDGASADHNFNWHDSIHAPIGGGGNPCGYSSMVPCDDHGHGTHTTGTAVGDDGAGNQIGVAPGAKWIGCRNMDMGTGRPETYTECFQFFIAPTDLNGQNADPTKRPHVMNNSWGCPATELCAPNSLQTIVESTRAAGIFVEVSAGNAGSGCSTVNDPPAIYDASYSTGATTYTGTPVSLAGFSSRGPVTLDGSNRIKPDISAPGVNVRSSLNTSDTTYSGHDWSGTSMAGPHVVGVVALLWQAIPALSRDIDATESPAERLSESQRLRRERECVWRRRPRPEQPLRVRARRRARCLQRRRPASATSSASASTARRVGRRFPAAADPVRACDDDRRHLHLRLRRLPLPGERRVDVDHGLPLQPVDGRVDDAG